MIIAFIGLGVMGAPIAAHLAKAGHHLFVYNRSPEKSRKWLENHPGNFALNPAIAAQDADAVVLCVGNDQDVREVIAGAQGILQTLRSGAVIIDHTTTSRDLSI